MHNSADEAEYNSLRKYIAQHLILMSGRHLQHGDLQQPQKNGTLFTNCSTATTATMVFYLLLNGSGVGTCYDDDVTVVDWSHCPNIIVTLDSEHPDNCGVFPSKEEIFASIEPGTNLSFLSVGDSREGWSKAVELVETITYKNKKASYISRVDYVVLDFSRVRPQGAPIAGMQDRPSSGPVPLMKALESIARLCRKSMKAPWELAMIVHHELAACVLVGGVRRSSRIACKYWKEPGAIDFIDIKRHGGLWTANNSLLVDADFWSEIGKGGLADDIFIAATTAAYNDRTGEPGFINVDRLTTNNSGLELTNIGGGGFYLSPAHKVIQRKIMDVCLNKKYTQIVNPCSEISLFLNSGFCVIGDLAPYFGESLDEIKDAARFITRALIRTNLMPSVYEEEVKRTNRIGVSLTGIHEFAFKFWGYNFHDLLDEEYAADFWLFLDELGRVVESEARSYSAQLGLNEPHTALCIKPSGSVAKIPNVTEGKHLPAMAEYLRWVQFRADDPMVDEYELKGYPVRRDLKAYTDVAIVGFPTQPEICKLGMGDRLVVIRDATIEQQYRWLQLLEQYWLGNEKANQISSTIKFNPFQVTLKEFQDAIATWQPKIRCASLMPQVETTAYEYQPEEPISLDYYNQLVARIQMLEEDIGLEHVQCAGAACPIDFKTKS